MARDFNLSRTRRSLFDALLDARARAGGKGAVVEDHDRNPLGYTDLVRASFALGRKLAAITAPGERVGVLLPTGVGFTAVFFALHAIGRVPVMLNYSSGPRNVKGACRAAGVRRVLCARKFVMLGKLEGLVDALEGEVEITWLEDVRASIGPADKAYALAAGLVPKLFRTKLDPDSPGVILFTSGSFGAPRGVVLSHANILANVEQVAAHIDLDPKWVFFSPLPTFHALGLIALLIPLFEGMKSFLYPSPLHFKQIPPLVRESGAAVLFATDTFIGQYVRSGDPADFAKLQFVVCGAEKVRDDTRRLFARANPGAPLLEGYGATEASPVIAVNQPEDNRDGFVGKLLPAIETRLEPVEGIPDGGRLYVRGPNIMSGYIGLTPETLEPLPGGWHDTGDVANIDADGFVRLLGRVKRFAKIGGEMISLTAVEDMALGAWPGARCAAVSVPDPRKGERLVLFTDHATADVGSLSAHARVIGAPELAVPKRIVKLPEVPVLGSGKTDYVMLQKLADEQASQAA